MGFKKLSAPKAGSPTIGWEINQLYTLQVAEEYAELPEAAVEKIMKSVIVAVATRGDFIPLKIASMLQEIEWQWKTNRGSLVKRIGKWLKENHNVMMPEELSTAIGNVVREFIVKDQVYYFDFTKRFDWKAGDFADDDSCFWMGGSRSDVLPAMEKDERFYAMRFFKREKQKALRKEHSKKIFYVDDEYFHRGIGRIWVCADSMKHLKKTVPLYITFNGYGLTTAQGTSVFTSYTNLSANRIGVINNKTFDGDLYANEGGMAVGDQSYINTVKNYDFGLDTNQFLMKVEKKAIDVVGKLDKEQKSTYNGGSEHWNSLERLPDYYKNFGSYKNKKSKKNSKPRGRGLMWSISEQPIDPDMTLRARRRSMQEEFNRMHEIAREQWIVEREEDAMPR